MKKTRKSCAISSANFTEIAGQGTKVVDVGRDFETMMSMHSSPYSQLRMYQFFAAYEGEERLHFALTWAASEEIFDAQIASVEEMMSSIEIEGAADIKAEQPELYGLTEEEVIVTANGQEVPLRVQAYAEVQQLSLNEESRTLSFTASPEHLNGHPTEMSISAVLEGPYQVMIDGEAADNSKYYTIEDEETDETEIVIRHRPNQEVSVVGMQVVREFPFALLVVAIAIGAGTIIARTRMFI